MADNEIKVPKTVKHTESYMPPLRYRTLWRRVSAEDEERRQREEKVRDLLPEEEEDTIGKVYDAGLLSRLMTYLKPYKGRTIWAVVLMAISSLLNVAAPWIIGRAIDDGIRAGSIEELHYWIFIFVAAALFEWITNRERISIMAYVGTMIVADTRSDLFRHLHKLTINFHNNYSVGRLMSRLISDVGILQDFITWSITGLARSLFILIGTVVAMVVMNWQLALVTFAMVPLMLILTNYWRKHVRTAYRATRTRLSLINGYLNESLQGIRVTQSFTREPENYKHFSDLNRSYFDANIQATTLTAIFFPGVDLIGSMTTALVVGVGGWLVLGDALTAGTLVAFVLYVERFFEPIRELAQRYNTFQATMAGCERLFYLLDLKPEILDHPEARILPAIKGAVEFDDVKFAYKQEEPILRGVSLRAEPGERVALVGETGAGKSTVIRLIARFFDVTGGAVKIDGYDIREVTQSSLRSQLGIVLQDPFLFKGTVADNIRYGKLDATDAAIISGGEGTAEEKIAALREAGASVARHPDEIAAIVAENLARR